MRDHDPSEPVCKLQLRLGFAYACTPDCVFYEIADDHGCLLNDAAAGGLRRGVVKQLLRSAGRSTKPLSTRTGV